MLKKYHANCYGKEIDSISRQVLALYLTIFFIATSVCENLFPSDAYWEKMVAWL